MINKPLFMAVWVLLAAVRMASAEEPPPAEVSIHIDAGRKLGGEDKIPRFLGVQGNVYDPADPKEAESWNQLHLFNDTSLPLFDEDGYVGGGMQVYRGTSRPTPTAVKVRHDMNLWIDPEKFDQQLLFIREKLRIDPRRMVLSIGPMPKVLAWHPGNEHPSSDPLWFVYRSPRDMNEWRAVLQKAGQLLCERGFCAPEAPPARVMLFHEAESGFLGRRLEMSDWGRLDDYLDLYVATQEALQSVMRSPVPVTIYASGASVYSGKLHAELSGNDNPLNPDHIIEKFYQKYPGKHFSGFAYQMYRFALDPSLADDYVLGSGTIRVGAEYLQSKLASHGNKNARIACFGYSGSIYSRNLNLPEGLNSKERDQLRRERARRLTVEEAAFLAANLADLLNPKINHPLYEATYYSFNFPEPPETEECNPNGEFLRYNLIASVHPASGCDLAESSQHCLRPPGVVMQTVADYRLGRLIDSELNAGDPKLHTLAARFPDKTIRILWAHRDGKALPAVSLTLGGLAPNRKHQIDLKVMEADLNLCANWKQVSSKSVASDKDGKAAVTLEATGSPVALLEIR